MARSGKTNANPVTTAAVKRRLKKGKVNSYNDAQDRSMVKQGKGKKFPGLKKKSPKSSDILSQLKPYMK